MGKKEIKLSLCADDLIVYPKKKENQLKTIQNNKVQEDDWIQDKYASVHSFLNCPTQ